MARSFTHLPITGTCKCRSERWDKIFWHRRFRRATRLAIYRNADLMPHRFDVSNVWSFGKDGKNYWTDRHIEISSTPVWSVFGK